MPGVFSILRRRVQEAVVTEVNPGQKEITSHNEVTLTEPCIVVAERPDGKLRVVAFRADGQTTVYDVDPNDVGEVAQPTPAPPADDDPTMVGGEEKHRGKRR